jgi:hypothetical protein
VANDIINDFAQFTVKLNWIIPMNAGNQIRALANVGLVFFTPLDPFMILITLFHCFTCSIACLRFGVVPCLSAQGHSASVSGVRKFAVCAFSTTWDFVKPRGAKILDKLSDLSWHFYRFSLWRKLLKEHRRITPALPYFVRDVQDVLHLGCPLAYDWMFHSHDELPVATGYVNPEAKRSRDFKSISLSIRWA